MPTKLSLTSRRIFRLSLTVALTLAGAYALRLPLPYIAPLFALMLTAAPTPPIGFKGLLGLSALVIILLGLGLLLIPLLRHYPLLGVMIVAMGLAALMAPGTLKRLLRHLTEAGRFYIVAVLRFVIGVLFLLAAGSTRLPIFVTAVGVLSIAAGLLMPVLGAARLKAIVDWWLARGDIVLRLWGLVACAFGLLLVWAGA